MPVAFEPRHTIDDYEFHWTEYHYFRTALYLSGVWMGWPTDGPFGQSVSPERAAMWADALERNLDAYGAIRMMDSEDGPDDYPPVCPRWVYDEQLRPTYDEQRYLDAREDFIDAHAPHVDDVAVGPVEDSAFLRARNRPMWNFENTTFDPTHNETFKRRVTPLLKFLRACGGFTATN